MQRTAHNVLSPVVPAATNTNSVPTTVDPPLHELSIDAAPTSGDEDVTRTLQSIPLPSFDAPVLCAGLRPILPHDLLSNTQLQYMFVVESQRGAPALFALKGWFEGDNASWFEAIARVHPQHGGTIDLRADGYQAMPHFDDILREYNGLIDEWGSRPRAPEQREWTATVCAIADRQRWTRPTHMQWTLVAIDDQSLIVWAGPHRIVQQPGATIHLYPQPLARPALLEQMRAQTHVKLVADAMRALLSQAMQTKRSLPIEPELHESAPPISLDDSLGVSVVAALRRQSWAIVPFTRRVELLRPFYKTHLQARPSSVGGTHTYVHRATGLDDLTIAHVSIETRMQQHVSTHTQTSDYGATRWQTVPSPVRSAFACPDGVAECCHTSAAAIQSVWRALYKDIPAQRAHVCFTPTYYNEYADDDHDMAVPPHIDYAACRPIAL